MKLFDLLIYFTFFIKLIFLCSSVYLRYLTFTHTTKSPDLIEKLNYWKYRSEFIFKACLSLILIILFNPRNTSNIITLDTETKLLLFIYGWIVISEADWGQFFKTSKLLHKT